jgi:FtsP/CotA-like multicopper oxidase with cupredoxin domain
MMGFQSMSDGRGIRTWYFGNGFNNDRSVPSPVIEGVEGQQVDVTLFSMMPHTIHFHGLDVDQANDGVPSTSGYVGHSHGGGGPGGVNFGRVDGYASLGTSFTYSFIAPHAGTYAYHCHVDTVLHFEMGMYGTVIIRPPDGSTGVAWAGGPAYDKEYVWHLHTFDSSWHWGSPQVSGPDTVRHRPDYFMINGRDGTNTLTDPATAVSAASGETVLIRANNMGYQPAMVRLGGLEFHVIASDGRPLPNPISKTQQLVAPGERYDLLVQMPSPGAWNGTVDYFNIRLTRILGTATSSITSA